MAHVCPWWLGYLFASPIRRLFQKPESILGPYVSPGMTALDVGPGMGFFTLPMARMVGESGTVVAVDMQESMLSGLSRRVARKGLSGRIETRTCSPTSLQLDDLAGRIDFALAFAMVYEVPDARSLMDELCAALVPGGKLLMSEPRGHVSVERLETSIQAALEAGFEELERPVIPRGHSVLLGKPAS